MIRNACSSFTAFPNPVQFKHISFIAKIAEMHSLLDDIVALRFASIIWESKNSNVNSSPPFLTAPAVSRRGRHRLAAVN